MNSGSGSLCVAPVIVAALPTRARREDADDARIGSRVPGRDGVHERGGVRQIVRAPLVGVRASEGSPQMICLEGSRSACHCDVYLCNIACRKRERGGEQKGG